MTALPAELLERARTAGLVRRTQPHLGWWRPGLSHLVVFTMLSGSWAWCPPLPPGAPGWRIYDALTLAETEAEALTAVLDWFERGGDCV